VSLYSAVVVGGVKMRLRERKAEKNEKKKKEQN
jgi:hypothetical protein